tara:strand:- start:8761 stop:9771 length:1011 start_codon:yes stop_codon:yes gene_type:complete
MDFSKPEILNLIFIIIPILFIFIIYYRWQKSIIHKFDKEILLKINSNYSSGIKLFHFLIRISIVILLVVALAGPRIGIKLQNIKREGVDVVFALDVSKSMLVEDIAPNRLLKGIQIISKSIDELVADRMGLIVYAGQAYPLMPLSFDYSMARLLIKTIDSNIVPSQGTDLGSAITLADNYFDKEDRSKILFFISDGEDHEGNYSQEIKNLSKRNITICAINIGTESGGPIPVNSNQGISYKKDNKGEVVISKANPQILNSISALGNGNFIKTKNTNDAIQFVLDNMKKLDKSFEEEEIFSDYEDQFQWLLFIALLFLIFDFILTKKKISFIKKLLS